MKTARAAWPLIVLLWVGSTEASEPNMTARLWCQREAVPGRVSCELEIEAARGSISWGDALVTRTPGFVQPLRARVGPGQASSRTDQRMRLPMGMVATENGEGQIEARARAVVCVAVEGRPRCSPLVREVRARVVVGPIDETR